MAGAVAVRKDIDASIYVAIMYCFLVYLHHLPIQFFTWSRTYIGVLFGMAASQSIHRDMIANVMAAPLGYFGQQELITRLVSANYRSIDNPS